MRGDMKCEYGTENCIHLGKEHDEYSCFNGWWHHDYICQSCGYKMPSNKHSMTLNPDGTYKTPEFKAQKCPRCKGEGQLV